MKTFKTLLKIIIILIFSTSSIFAQEVTKKRKHINSIWDADYEVLTSDKKIKHGLYTVQNTLNKKAIAVGKYSNNHQSGNWLYYSVDGKLEQRYNFETNKLLFHNPMMMKNATYKFPIELSLTDSVIAPIKVGGIYYGLYHIIFEQNSQAISYAFRTNQENYKLLHYLHINEEGLLTKWESSVKTSNKEQFFKNKIEDLDDEQKLFVPANYKQKPISSVMIIEMDLINNSVRKLPYQ